MIISVGQRTAFQAKIAVETRIEIAHWHLLYLLNARLGIKSIRA